MHPAIYSYTPADDSLTGFATGITGAGPFTIPVTTPGDGLAHLVSIQSGANLSAITFTLTGTDPDGRVQTEAVVGPNVATVYGTKFFKTLTTVSVSSTLGANTANIGWKDESTTPTIPLNWRQDSFSVSVAVNISGTINYTVDHCFQRMSDGPASAFFWLPSTGLVNETADGEESYTTPLTAIRLHINSLTAGATAALHMVQGR